VQENKEKQKGDNGRREGGRGGGGKGEACFNPKVESIVQVSNLR